MVEMVKVREAEQVEAVADLAREIWNEHFVSIIGLPLRPAGRLQFLVADISGCPLHPGPVWPDNI